MTTDLSLLCGFNSSYSEALSEFNSKYPVEAFEIILFPSKSIASKGRYTSKRKDSSKYGLILTTFCGSSFTIPTCSFSEITTYEKIIMVIIPSVLIIRIFLIIIPNCN